MFYVHYNDIPGIFLQVSLKPSDLLESMQASKLQLQPIPPEVDNEQTFLNINVISILF